MFQISTSPATRKAASALTVLTAIGASGMLAEAAPVELEPSQAARTTNSSYAYVAGSWKDWKAETGSTNIGTGQYGYVTWNIDFGAGPINQATFRLNPIWTGDPTSYGIPTGANIHLNLLTDTWSPAAPKPFPDSDGPDVGTAVGTEAVTIASPSDHGTIDLDVTSLLQHWQANPTMYHGIRVLVDAQRGGVYAPDDTSNGMGTTGNLIIDQLAVPEPTSLGVLVVGSMLALRRRHK